MSYSVSSSPEVIIQTPKNLRFSKYETNYPRYTSPIAFSFIPLNSRLLSLSLPRYNLFLRLTPKPLHSFSLSFFPFPLPYLIPPPFSSPQTKHVGSSRNE